MKAKELIEAKQTYDELKAHFAGVIAAEILAEFKRKSYLPRDGSRPDFNAGADACEKEVAAFVGRWL
jgi:hypothetical protein